jgi:O-antigen biosynthesis protein
LQTAFASADARSFFGFAVDRGDLARKFIIEILVDGYPIKAVRADSLVHELARDRVGDGCYGFSLTLDEAIANDAAVVEARLANLGTPIGAPIDCPMRRSDPTSRDRCTGSAAFTSSDGLAKTRSKRL